MDFKKLRKYVNFFLSTIIAYIHLQFNGKMGGFLSVLLHFEKMVSVGRNTGKTILKFEIENRFRNMHLSQTVLLASLGKIVEANREESIQF